ncbi:MULTISPECIES: hypothetical protein [Paenibacillus]|uniref:hypothetical protein n=1 Tax=Paenibacillus TaxID=44249 RepID=UPI001642E349|nr:MULTISPECIES: hypothetical protein [Paenibacillus]MBJ9990007.1 hypothetical protein [Paenibacillus sp. S28]
MFSIDTVSFVLLSCKNAKSALIPWDEERLLAVPPNLTGLPEGNADPLGSAITDGGRLT